MSKGKIGKLKTADDSSSPPPPPPASTSSKSDEQASAGQHDKDASAPSSSLSGGEHGHDHVHSSSNGSSSSSRHRPLHHQHHAQQLHSYQHHQQQQQQQHPGEPQQYFGHYMKWGGDRGTHPRGSAVRPGGSLEDDSLHYLSEPSVSEDADSTTTGALERSLLTSEDDDYDDPSHEDGEVPPPPPPGPPPPRRHDSHGSGGADVASPGNTSLSSWESIAHVRSHNNNQRHNRVRIHFSPEQPRTNVAAAYNYFGHQQQQHANYYYQQQQQQQRQQQQADQQPQYLIPPQASTAAGQHGSQQQPDIIPQEQTTNTHQNSNNASPNSTVPNTNETTTASGVGASNNNNTNPMSYSNSYSVSTMSSVSTQGRQKLNKFIHDLRQQSEGAVVEVAATDGDDSPSVLNTSTEDNDSFALHSQPQQQQQQQSASDDNNKNRRKQKAAAGVTSILRHPPPTTARNNNNNNNMDTLVRSSSSRHRRISSVETELIGNTSDAYLEEEEGMSDHSDGHDKPKEHLFSMEESPLKLNLSLLGDEEDHGVDATGTRLFTGKHESSDGGNHRDTEKVESSQSQEQQQVPSLSLAPTPRNSNTNNSAILGNSNHTYSTTTTDGDDAFFRGLALESYHSADDEQTQLRPPRKRGVGKPSSLHRRTRSGDGAAAALTTGGHDWKGMFKDKIRLPDAGDDDDDDEEDGGHHNISNKGKPLNGKAITKGDDNGNAQSFHKNAKINGETALFAIGTPDGSRASRTAARKQRRESRQQHRTVAEKAAAVAKERKIKKQYQEWARSPLWKMAGRKDRGHMDSSEISLGSIPSTIEPRFNNSSAAGDVDSDDFHQDEGEVLQRRTSLDTIGSGLTMPSVFGHGGGRAHNRRGSTGSNHSIFSWISAFNDDPNADVSPHSDQRLQVHPNWSPQSASLASPFLQQRKQAHARQHYHQRSNTAMAGSGPSHSERGYGSNHPLTQQQQESFRRLLTQQQMQSLGSDSFRHLSPDSDAPFRGSPGVAQVPPPPHLMTSMSDNDDFARRQNELREILSSSDHTTTSSSEEEDDEYNVMDNRVHQMHPRGSVLSLNRAEEEAETELLKRGSVQHVLRSGQRGGSPFANFGRKQAATGPRKFDRMSFLPKTSVLLDNQDQVDYPTYQCPRCQTIQREFFTVNSAPRQFETASGFLAFAFVAYVIASLYIFGLEVRQIGSGFCYSNSSLSLNVSIFFVSIRRKDGQR